MYRCPSCGAPTITFWQKQLLGPAKTIRCSNCNARISVSWTAGLLYTALLLAQFFAVLLVGLAVWDKYDLAAASAAVVLASAPFFALIAVVQHRFVELIVRRD